MRTQAKPHAGTPALMGGIGDRSGPSGNLGRAPSRIKEVTTAVRPRRGGICQDSMRILRDPASRKAHSGGVPGWPAARWDHASDLRQSSDEEEREPEGFLAEGAGRREASPPQPIRLPQATQANIMSAGMRVRYPGTDGRRAPGAISEVCKCAGECVLGAA